MTEEMTSDYAQQVGERLRDIRRQQGLSLQAAEAMSDREFKASVLGAYERGERIISVLRLQRLARFYGVPVDQLLPRDIGPMPSLPHRDDDRRRLHQRRLRRGQGHHRPDPARGARRP